MAQPSDIELSGRCLDLRVFPLLNALGEHSAFRVPNSISFAVAAIR